MEKNNIGKKLRERRLELELTQREIANYVGVTEATVSRWESGEIDNMRRDKIANLAKVLKVSPLLIMGIDEEKSANSLITFEEKELINSYNSLTADGKTMISTMLKSLRVTHSAAI